MGTMHEILDGSETDLVEAERKAFEADAGPYDFDLTRVQSAAPEPWSEYDDYATGHRWGGWLAAASAKSIEIDRLRAALEKIASRTQDTGLLWWQIEAREALKTPNA